MTKKKQKSHPNWHPDFRLQEELPDIKPIRTDFLVNGIAWALAVFLIFGVVQREIGAASTRGRLADTQEQIKSRNTADKAHLAESKKLLAFLPRLQDIERFYAAPIVYTEFVADVVKLIPEEIILSSMSAESFNITEKKKVLPSKSITLKGTAPSLLVIDQLKEDLVQMTEFQEHNGSVEELPSSRDAVTGLFSFTIEVTLTPEFK